MIISIEGNIGSGKSTLLKLLKEYFKDNNNIIFLQEPVDEWNHIKDNNNVTILEKFYMDQKKYSFAFQMMAYISRLSLITKTINEFPNAIIITERCLNTDRYVFAKMLYDSGKMEDVEYQIYIKWFDHFNSIIKNTKTIYLDTLPDVCFIRINKRNREGESNISLEYLENCNKYHNDMVDNINKDKLLIIDGNIDTDNNINIYNLWCENIKNFIYNEL